MNNGPKKTYANNISIKKIAIWYTWLPIKLIASCWPASWLVYLLRIASSTTSPCSQCVILRINTDSNASASSLTTRPCLIVIGDYLFNDSLCFCMWSIYQGSTNSLINLLLHLLTETTKESSDLFASSLVPFTRFVNDLVIHLNEMVDFVHHLLS